MHCEIQDSLETHTSIPLTLVLTKTHTRRASDPAPDVGSGLTQQKEADYSLSLSFTFHLFIFTRFHSTRAEAHFTSVFTLKLRFEAAAGVSEPQGSICSPPAVLRSSAGVWWTPFKPAGTKTYARFTPNISVKCQLLCLHGRFIHLLLYLANMEILNINLFVSLILLTWKTKKQQQQIFVGFLFYHSVNPSEEIHFNYKKENVWK